MTDLVQFIQQMPLSGLVPVCMALVAGIVLWAAGRRILRGAFVVMGLILGVFGGLLLEDAWRSGLPPWVLPAIAGVALALVAALTYRLAAAVMMAIVLGLACPLTVAAVNELQVQRGRGITADNDDQIEVRDSISDALHQRQDQLDRVHSEINELKHDLEQRTVEAATRRGFEDEAVAGIERVKSLEAAVTDTLRTRWDDTPKRLRPILMLSGIVGALTGLILALVARRFSDCAVTAAIGAALWLGSAHVIAARAGVPEGPWLPRGMLVWLGLWLIITVIGLSIQWARRPRPADKPA